MYKSDVLFVLKKRELVSSNSEDWNYMYSNKNSSGLYNSVKFVNDMLVKAGVNSNMYEAIDNNYIDSEVTRLKPKIVIIEALWVVPEKFDVLVKLHPDVKWIIRLHSEIPFIAVEGMSMEWLRKLAHKSPNIYIAANAPRALGELQTVLKTSVLYMPNYYPVSDNVVSTKPPVTDTINVGCFGAIRALKNHLMQAIVAIRFAEYYGYKLKFHINSSRKEMSGEPILKNLFGLFENDPKHELVQHEWMPHNEFVDLLNSKIDIAMQVSFSETYNIVSADCVNNNVPIVTSKEVTFVPEHQQADPTDSEDIFIAMRLAWETRGYGSRRFAKYKLRSNSTSSSRTWIALLKQLGV